jgi:hypothetical protein
MDTLRISDADREAAVDLLGEQYAVGRLTKDEFDERSDAVWSARTRGDLAPVFADLPVRSPALPARTGRRPSPPAPRWAPPRTSRWAVPLLPVLLVLIAIAVVAQVPFLLLAIGLWFAFGRCNGARRSRY